MVKPKKNDDRAATFADKKQSEGSRQVNAYLSPVAIEVLENLKRITGYGNTALLNLIFEGAKDRPHLLLALIQFDFESHKKSIEYFTDKLEAAKEIADWDDEAGIDAGES